MNGRHLVAAVAALTILGGASQAAARTCTWTPSSASIWSSSASWTCDSGSGPPSSTDTAVFDSSSIKNCGISSATTVGALTINSTYTGVITMTASLAVSGAVTMGGGSLNAGSSALSMGSLSLSAGTLTLSTASNTVAGAFTNSGGTISATGAALTLTGSGALTLTPGATTSFGSVTINASGATYTLGSALQMTGDLTITAGALAASTRTISVGGSWSNSGTFTTSAAVTLTSTSSSATLKSNGSSFASLTINGSGGTYTMQDALTTTGNLTLTAGKLVASSYNLTVGGAMSMAAGSFTGGSGTVAITGDLSMTGGGTWTGGSGTATVGGNVSVSDSSTADSTLVGYWPLDDSATPSVDSSGNGNSLTWSGSPTTTTAVPSAISFTDTRALAMTGAQAATSSSTLSTISALRPTTVTLSAWYKATNVDTAGADIVSGSNTYVLRITSTGAMVTKRISDNTSAADWIEYRAAISGVLDGGWHHLVGEIVTGTGGGMTIYFDGTVVSGNYWVNGTNGAVQLTSSTSPTAASAAVSAIDWSSNTETYGLLIGNNPSTSGYRFGANCSGTACAIDDVRVYSRALSATDVKALARGSASANVTSTLSLTGTMNVTGTVTIQSTGALTLASGSSLAVGSALTMDGTLTSTGGKIQAVSATNYAFKVGSTASATPTLNINGLTVKNTDTNGMWINANTGASTTFTRFDKLAFSNGTGTQLLQIYASSLYLTSNGCSFDGSATYAVTLTGNGSGNGPRAIFGNATCGSNDATSGLCATGQKYDDDADNDGAADHPTSNGAVVQFVRGGQSDTSGTLVGFPTAAFDWNGFTYYSTYVVFHDASASSDVIYVRDQAGNPLYSWTDPSPDETIVGTPQWITSSNTHYLYVAVNGGTANSGKVYRLKDTGTGTTSGTLTLDTGWATSGAYSCSCTLSSNLSLDTSNVYWAATTSSAQVLMGITQSSGANISTSWPVTTPANVTTSSPTLFTLSGTTKLYLGITAKLLQLDVTGTTFVQNSNPGTITGRVGAGTSLLAATAGTSRIYAGDSSGTMWAISPTGFSGTNLLWSYAGSSAITNSTYDAGSDTVQFGTAGGKVVVLNASTGAVMNSSYPYTLDTTDPITAAPLYYSGVLVVGTTKGKLYFIDRNTGTGVSVIKTFSFGSTQSVSTVAFDPTNYRYMVSTSSSASDGRLYYFDLVNDPTASSP